MSDLSPAPSCEIPPLEKTCPFADSWAHAEIAESLGMPMGTLLEDARGPYCPACDYRPVKDAPKI